MQPPHLALGSTDEAALLLDAAAVLFLLAATHRWGRPPIKNTEQFLSNGSKLPTPNIFWEARYEIHFAST